MGEATTLSAAEVGQCVPISIQKGMKLIGIEYVLPNDEVSPLSRYLFKTLPFTFADALV